MNEKVSENPALLNSQRGKDIVRRQAADVLLNKIARALALGAALVSERANRPDLSTHERLMADMLDGEMGRATEALQALYRLAVLE